MQKWILQDRYGNIINLLCRGAVLNILESCAELEPHFDLFLETLRTGRRKQEPMLPNEYRYYKQFDELLPDNNHLVAIVVFKTQLTETGSYVSNNFVVTGWTKFIVPKR